MKRWLGRGGRGISVVVNYQEKVYRRDFRGIEEVL